MRVLAILTDEKDKTIGARIQTQNGVFDYSTAKLRTVKADFDNAILRSDGYVQAKSGSLERIIWKNPNIITLYHGNKDKDMRPKYGVGGTANDYGSGFYTTQDIELAKEWAWNDYSRGRGYLHTYNIDMAGLNILDFTKLSPEYWVAELIHNRKVNLKDVQIVFVGYLNKFKQKYKMNTDSYDIIRGYRADDSYFSYIRDFVIGGISIELLESIMNSGNLGTQVFIKSNRAFKRLNFESAIEIPRVYHTKYQKRLNDANDYYRQSVMKPGAGNGRTIRDLI